MSLLTRLAGMAAAVLVAACSGTATAALLVYEPFDYPAGTVLNGTAANGLNLTGIYEPTDTFDAAKIVVSSPGLDYGNLSGVPAARGNRANDVNPATTAIATVSVDNDVLVGPGDSIYWSALFTLDDSSNLNHRANITFRNDNGDELGFGEPTVGGRAIRVEANTAATGELIADGADQSFIDGQTLLLLGRYINSAADNGDRLDLIGYNTADSHPLPLSFQPTDPNAEFAYELEDLNIDFEKITSITFTIRGSGNNFIDELRIGSTYGAVVPEPAAPALLLVAGCVAGVLRAWRRNAR